MSNRMTVVGNSHRLAAAVLGLSLPGKEAVASIPEGPNRVDRLALLFDEEYTDFMGTLAALPSESQLIALQELDGALNAISGPDNRSLWTEAAVEQDPHWAEIRELANRVLREFGWQAEPSS
jgi:hypothetical protein